MWSSRPQRNDIVDRTQVPPLKEHTEVGSWSREEFEGTRTTAEDSRPYLGTLDVHITYLNFPVLDGGFPNRFFSLFRTSPLRDPNRTGEPSLGPKVKLARPPGDPSTNIKSVEETLDFFRHGEISL